jgi:DNA (cytosine-5)-methyltransferase 1
MSIKIGSLFAGIGGFELGLERALPNSRTIWQVEKNTFCQEILRKHWPDATIYDDVRTVGAHNLESIDLLCGGFPCQDISTAGKQKGVNDGKKSSLWWQMHRIIGELRPRIAILENVANVISVGGADVVGSLAKIGYDCEWTIIRSASDFGAPHKRERWFCVAYPHSLNKLRAKRYGLLEAFNNVWPYTGSQSRTVGRCDTGTGYWGKVSAPAAVCRVDDGIPAGMDRSKHNRIRKERLKSLGNAIVPQASEWIGRQIVQSGLIDDLLGVE